MKRVLMIALALAALALAARADLVRLVSGKHYQGMVVSWGPEEISFVLQGGAMADAFVIPARLIEYVVLPDSTAHRPGTDSWIAAGRVERLPWERRQTVNRAADSRTGQSPSRDLLSFKSWTFQAAPLAVKRSGYASYQISFPWDAYGDVGESRLDFPLDGYAAGIRASMRSRPQPGQLRYGGDLSFARTLTDPRADMADSDWARTATGDYRHVFSVTASASRAGGWEVCATAVALYPAAADLELGVLLGYFYLRSFSDIYGVTGWQDTLFMSRGIEGDKVYFSDFQNTRVGQYTVSYRMPMLGLAMSSETAQGFALQARGAYLFSVSASDEDLHLLRNKRSTCSASGSGWQLDGQASIRIAALKNKSSVALGASYEYLKADTKGSQTQSYYADDPYFPGDQTGYSITGISDKLFLRRHSFGLFVTYTF